jgi:hypothetical protein
MLHVFFWVVTRRVVFKSRRIGTLCLFHLCRRVDIKWLTSYPLSYEDGTDTVYRNVGYYTPHAGEQPKIYTHHVRYCYT